MICFDQGFSFVINGTLFILENINACKLMKYFVIVLLYYCCAFDGVVSFEQVQKVTYGRKKNGEILCVLK